MTPCPEEKPYFDGAECIECELPQYFDAEANQCLNCTEGQ